MGNVLCIGNVYSRLRSSDQKVKTILWKSLRFRERNYFHSTAYNKKKWDGFRDFFTLKAGQFLTGLLPEVRFVLKTLDVDYDIIDNRTETPFLRESINEDFLWNRYHKKPVVLRDYQIDLTNQIIKNRRGVIEAKTGAGKTYILISALKCLPPKTPSLVLVDTKDLVYQNYEAIKMHGFDDVGMFFSDVKKINYITVCLVNSANRLDALFPKVKALFVDEIHAMMSKRSVNVYKKLTNADIRVGFSATPFKFGGKDQCQKYAVKGHIGGILKTNAADGGKLTTEILQDRKILSKTKCTFFKVNYPERQYDIYGDAVTFGIAQNQHLHNAVAKLVQKIKGRTLIVVERIEHGEKLNKLIPNSYWLYGEQKRDIRKAIIEDLKVHKGDFIAIAVDKIVNKGLDVFIHNLINCSGGKADHQVLQRMGRGLRMANDKDILNYFDFYFTLNPYLEKHSNERVKVLEREGHNIEIKELDAI